MPYCQSRQSRQNCQGEDLAHEAAARFLLGHAFAPPRPVGRQAPVRVAAQWATGRKLAVLGERLRNARADGLEVWADGGGGALTASPLTCGPACGLVGSSGERLCTAFDPREPASRGVGAQLTYANPAGASPEGSFRRAGANHRLPTLVAARILLEDAGASAIAVGATTACLLTSGAPTESLRPCVQVPGAAFVLTSSLVRRLHAGRETLARH